MKRFTRKQFEKSAVEAAPVNMLDDDFHRIQELAAQKKGEAWALTVKPLWAWLIVNGHKDIENRSRRTNYRGPLHIHASKGFNESEYGAAWKFVHSIDPKLAALVPDYPTLMRDYAGRVIGRVEVVDVYDPHPPAFTSYWHFEGNYGYKLEGAREFDVRPLYRGQLGFFRLDANTSKLVKDL